MHSVVRILHHMRLFAVIASVGLGESASNLCFAQGNSSEQAAIEKSQAARIDYLQQVKPLLQNRCYACHGAIQQKAGLRLDTGKLIRKGSASGAVVDPSAPESSQLVDRISSNDAAYRMPPDGEPLTAQQIQALKHWIAEGAASPADEQPELDPRLHWAFAPLKRPNVPSSSVSPSVGNAIDAFLDRDRNQRGLQARPPATRLLLLRRLTMDLIGVPATSAEAQRFLNDDSVDAYESAMERLLNDPRHGQRWARHWMDVWRYSDWWGLGEQLRNSQKHIWHWRDWIVESLNADMPYDEMVRQMLAADELYPNDLDKLRATGYLARNYFLFNRHQWMDEVVEHVSKGFFGLTMNCAKCHDHKYDPITQVDYYKLRAFFEPYHVRLDVLPGQSDIAHDALPRAYDGLLDTPTYRFERGQESMPDKSVTVTPGVPQLLQFDELVIHPVALPLEAWQPERRPWVLDAFLSDARKKLDAAQSGHSKAREKFSSAQDENADSESKISELALASAQAELTSVECRAAAMRATWDREDAGDASLNSELEACEKEAARAAARAEREAVVANARHALAVAEHELNAAAAGKKGAIEKKVTAAREALSKAEKQLVETGEQYTKLAGAAWTPTRFLSSTKDDPTVAFPSTSTGRRSALARWITDRRNPLTARVAANQIWMRHMGAPLAPTVFDLGRKGIPPLHRELLDWLACELLDSGWSMKHLHRLIVMSAAYRMSSSVAGADSQVRQDPDNFSWWRRTPIRLESQVVRDAVLSLAGLLDSTLGGPSVPPAEQSDSKRRSLYFFHSDNDRNLFLSTFDEALVKDCYRREQSIVPQQALALANSELILDAAPRIARRIERSNELPSHAAGPTRPIDDAEFIRRAFAIILGISANDAEVSASLQALRAWQAAEESSVSEARTNLIWALLNHNDFVTLR